MLRLLIVAYLKLVIVLEKLTIGLGKKTKHLCIKTTTVLSE